MFEYLQQRKVLGFNSFNPEFLGLWEIKSSYSRRCALSYGKNRFQKFLLEVKLWHFENAYVVYHGIPLISISPLIDVFWLFG